MKNSLETTTVVLQYGSCTWYGAVMVIERYVPPKLMGNIYMEFIVSKTLLITPVAVAIVCGK